MPTHDDPEALRRAALRLPETTVARLPRYLHALESAQGPTIASTALAAVAGVNAAIVRKDLSYLGGFGTRGVGYDVEGLVRAISTTLGVVEERPVLIVGAGNLGRALAAYDGFERRGFRMVAVLDTDPRVVGSDVAGMRVAALSDLDRVVADHPDPVAVLAIPADAADEVVATLADHGVSAILNFAPTSIEVPEHVTVRGVDLSTELQVLSFHDRVRRLRLAPRAGRTA